MPTIKKGDATYNTLRWYFNTAGIPEYIWWPIVLQESGGNPQAVGDNGTSYGLFQIHFSKGASEAEKLLMFNPLANARAALNLWKNRPIKPDVFAKQYAKEGTPEYVAYFWIAAQRPRAWTEFQKTHTFNSDMERIRQIAIKEFGITDTWTGGQQLSGQDTTLAGELIPDNGGGIVNVWNDIKSFFTKENMLNVGILLLAAISLIFVIYSIALNGGK